MFRDCIVSINWMLYSSTSTGVLPRIQKDDDRGRNTKYLFFHLFLRYANPTVGILPDGNLSSTKEEVRNDGRC